jgi:hypothetical protein
LNIHVCGEHVSVERAEKELYAFYRVQSFSELHVHPDRLDALVNLSRYNKDVIFYMQVFKQIFNLCTLHDLGPLLAKFLKVATFDELRIGPLEKHPAIKETFQYQPRSRKQPIPEITCADVIDAFLKFQEHHPERRVPFQTFLDELVSQYRLRRHEELGIYCKPFSYLVEVSLDPKITFQYSPHNDANELQNNLFSFTILNHIIRV